MNPEKVKKEYFKTLKDMSESENPQDRRSALAEWGKVYRQEQTDKDDLIESLASELNRSVEIASEYRELVKGWNEAGNFARKIEAIVTLDKETRIPVTRYLLRELGYIERGSHEIPEDHEWYVEAVESGGGWPDNVVHDVNLGRAKMQSMGCVGTEPILFIEKDLYELIQTKTKNGLQSYEEALVKNGLLSGIAQTNANLKERAFLIAFEVDYYGSIPLPPKTKTVIIKNITT